MNPRQIARHAAEQTSEPQLRQSAASLVPSQAWPVTRSERGMRRQPLWAVRLHAPPLDVFLTNGQGRLAAAGMAGTSCTADNGCESCR